MDGRIDPSLATDLSKVSDEKLATDLSKSAIEARDLKRRLGLAAEWARDMKRTFKGIRGCKTRRQYAELAIERYGISREDLERIT